MDVPLNYVQSVKEIFLALTALQMTAYLYPPHAELHPGKDTFDYIVVGAGSAGSVVANRLTENEHVTVLLVEAGGDPPLHSVLPAYFTFLTRSKWDWNFTSVLSDIQKCHKNKILNLPQGKMLGGSSSINWMCYVTGHPRDYNNWASITKDKSWSYKNILPLLKQNENLRDNAVLNSPNGYYHGTNGNVGVIRQRSKIIDKYLKSFKELGHDIVLDTNGKDTLGFSHVMLNIANGVRQSSAYSFLRPAQNRPNLFLLKNTKATKILFDSNKNAVGIETLNEKEEKKTFKARKEVIISAGAINTPHLLMLSGIGPKEHLEEIGIPVIADLPVGENLQDHSPVIQGFPTDEDVSPDMPINPHEYPQPTLIGYVALNKSQPYPDYQVLGSIIDSKALLVLGELTTTYREDIIQKIYNESKGKNILLLYTTKVKPKSRGKILLRSSNPKDHPMVDLGIYSNKDDLDDVIKYNKDISRIVETTFFKSVNSKVLTPPGCEDLDTKSEEYWSCHVQCLLSIYYHFVGTCAMGSVVDSKLRVFGVQKLRVVDGSIMPTITSGNTNVPIMMIGQKGADMIKEDLNNMCDYYSY